MTSFSFRFYWETSVAQPMRTQKMGSKSPLNSFQRRGTTQFNKNEKEIRVSHFGLEYTVAKRSTVAQQSTLYKNWLWEGRWIGLLRWRRSRETVLALSDLPLYCQRGGDTASILSADFVWKKCKSDFEEHFSICGLSSPSLCLIKIFLNSCIWYFHLASDRFRLSDHIVHFVPQSWWQWMLSQSQAVFSANSIKIQHGPPIQMISISPSGTRAFSSTRWPSYISYPRSLTTSVTMISGIFSKIPRPF